MLNLNVLWSLFVLIVLSEIRARFFVIEGINHSHLILIFIKVTPNRQHVTIERMISVIAIWFDYSCVIIDAFHNQINAFGGAALMRIRRKERRNPFVITPTEIHLSFYEDFLVLYHSRHARHTLRIIVYSTLICTCGELQSPISKSNQRYNDINSHCYK